MDRERRNGVVSNGNHNSSSSICRKLDYDDLLDRGLRNRDNIKVPIMSLPSPTPPSSSSSSSLGFIEHHVSKFDTLAGVAIKYGVEVADVRKMNGLLTDRQMFALKSLHIPLPGRHPPSPCLSSSSDNPGGGSGFSTITGRGLALRNKAASKTDLTADGDMPVQLGVGDPNLLDGFISVRKSSSTSSLQEQESSSNGSVWPTSKWSLKTDLQALSTSAIARPIFDALPKPITGRKNKAALD
ncbi:hypothetical protein ACFE04_031222 [Oxalis oulophora]